VILQLLGSFKFSLCAILCEQETGSYIFFFLVVDEEEEWEDMGRNACNFTSAPLWIIPKVKFTQAQVTTNMMALRTTIGLDHLAIIDVRPLGAP